MKKRIALAAAIALAISVGGMLPASAAKLTAPSGILADACARAGGTLEIIEDGTGAGNLLTLGSDGTNLLITAADGGEYCFDHSVSLALSGLTSIVVKSESSVTFLLEKGTDNVFTTWGSAAFTVRIDGTLTFSAASMDAPLRPVTATVTEESFNVGVLNGAYYAGTAVAFLGGNADDVLDASTVTTTSVMADGGLGADTLKGGALEDSLTGDAGEDVLYGNAGDDMLYSDEGAGCTVVLNPQDHPTSCRGAGNSADADEAWGGAGDDTIDSDGGDVVAPGDGNDTISDAFLLAYGDSSAAIALNLTTAAGVVKSTAGTDYYTTAAGFAGSEFADTMIGNGSVNAFYGEAGADTIVGGGGADKLNGGGGTDAIKGGGIAGQTDGNDVIYGDSGADKINGGIGNDTVYGGGGDDILYGSVGDDVLRGMKGSDQAWGGRGTFDVCAAEVTDSCEFKK